MKDPIIQRIEELRKFSVELNVFLTFLNAIIVFLVFAIILRVFGIIAIVAILPAMVYAVASFALSIYRINVLKSVTSNYPSLDERLQTAYDNRKERNIIVDSLIKEVSRRMDDIRYSSFLNSQQLTSRMIISTLLVFMFITINYINPESFGLDLRGLVDRSLLDGIEDLTGFNIYEDDGFNPGEDDTWATKHKVEEDIIGGSTGGKLPGVNEGPISGFGGGGGDAGDENIFGDPSAAKIEGKNLDMDLHPEYGGEIEIKDVNDRRRIDEFTGELEAKSSGAAEQDPVEYQELIKRYFQSLQNIEQEIE